MGQVADCLNCFFEWTGRQLINEERQKNGGRETNQQMQRTYQKCISNGFQKFGLGKYLDKITEANPFAAPNTFEYIELLKCHNQADHWGVVEE